MQLSDADKNARFHDQIAPKYDMLMARHTGNAWVRGAFRQLVRETVPTGAHILDFGCGTGTDSLWYAQHNYRVLAYDNSAAMVEELRRKCAAEIAADRVRPFSTDYAPFPNALRSHPELDAVASDFAVLNHIQVLPPLFEVFARQMTPSGVVVASVLNPFFWQDIIHSQWWRPCLRGLRTGYVSCVGDYVSHYRHLVSRIARAARPHFRLIRQASVGAFLRYDIGEHIWGEPRSLAEKIEARGWGAFPVRHLGKYLFLVFQRVA